MPAENDPPKDSRGLRERVGLWLGPLVFLLILLLPPPDGMPVAAWRTTATAALMAIWWVSEAIPISATAFVPLVVFPLLGVAPIADAAAPYANPIIFLFMGGLILALAMERRELHRRVALSVVRAVGVKPDRLVLGVMIATALISMWVSNTATAVMMLPIALSVADLVRVRGDDGLGEPMDPHFPLNLMLGVAYAANIGGFGTLIGTPPNALFAGFMSESYGVEIGFGQWMAIGVPLVVVTLPVSWLVLTRVFYPIRLREIPGGREAIERAYRALGPVTAPEWRVGAVFAVTGLLWILRPAIDFIPGLDDAGIAIASALALFLLPAGKGKGALMDWKTAERMPWGVLLLFGGGLSLAGAVTSTGLAEWIGAAMSGLGWSSFAMVATVTIVIVFLTELTSNTATAATFLPLTASIALGLGENPLLLTLPAALAASAGFMLPAGTPPNAIVYGSGYVTIPQMARAGVWINILFIVSIVTLMYTVGLWVFAIEPGVLPAWATSK